MNRVIRAGLVAIITSASAAAAYAQHGEIGVGRTSDNRLVPHMHFDQPAPIPRSVFPGITGFATGAIGFESVPEDEPAENLFSLDPGCDIGVMLVGVDPAEGVRIYNGPVPLAIGGSLQFGAPFFDFHVLMNIPSPAATNGEVFTFRFVLHDAAGIHADSEEFELSLTPACPADFNVSGSVSSQDIFDFLAAFFANFPAADFNMSRGVSAQDIFDFLAAFFSPCP